jgi:methyl-accepting chemotaxis protein
VKNLFSSWTLRRRIVAGFAAVVVAFSLLGVWQLSEVKNVKTGSDELYDISYHGVSNVNEMKTMLDSLTGLQLRAATEEHPEDRAEAIKQSQAYITEFKKRLEFFQGEADNPEVTPEEKQAVVDIADSITSLETSYAQANTLTESGKAEAALEILDKTYPVVAKGDTGLEGLIQAHKNEVAAWHEEVDARYSTFVNGTRIVDVLLATLAIALGLLIARSVNQLVQALAARLTQSSRTLAESGTKLSQASEGAALQANAVASTSSNVSQNVNMVAASVEQMNASISEIAHSTAEASQVAAHAMGVVTTTNATVAQLGDSSIEIGKVLEVITSIAEQTNLLALNATIEAARAGDAGKGFAVVANEVKELAKETAAATDQIGQRIAAIQGDTQGAVSAIGEISDVIDRINNIQSTIAAAIEEQTATTTEIVRSIAEAATGSGAIAESIAILAESSQDVARSAQDSTAVAETVGTVTKELAALAGQQTDQWSTTPNHVSQPRNYRLNGPAPTDVVDRTSEARSSR